MTGKLTLDEMEKKILELSAAVDIKSKEFETFKAAQQAELKKRDDELAALKACKHFKGMDEEEDKKDEEKEDEDKKDEEKEAMKAELIYLRKQASLPKITFLEKAFEGRIDAKALAAMRVEWEKQTPEQLDAEIQKIKPFVAMQTPQTQEPIGFSSLELPAPFTGAVQDEYIAKINKMSVSELASLNGGIGN
jgi:hypothetical protein